MYCSRSLKKQVPPQKHPTGRKTLHTSLQSVSTKPLQVSIPQLQETSNTFSPSLHLTTFLLCQLFQATPCWHSLLLQLNGSLNIHTSPCMVTAFTLMHLQHVACFSLPFQSMRGFHSHSSSSQHVPSFTACHTCMIVKHYFLEQSKSANPVLTSHQIHQPPTQLHSLYDCCFAIIRLSFAIDLYWATLLLIAAIYRRNTTTTFTHWSLYLLWCITPVFHYSLLHCQTVHRLRNSSHLKHGPSWTIPTLVKLLHFQTI